MKLRSTVLAAMAVCCLLAADAAAHTKVTLSGVHLCCGGCVKVANKVIAGVDGAEGKVDRAGGTISITAGSATTAQAALNALSAAGFHGASDNDQIAINDDSGASGNAKRVVLTGAHNCCGGCAKALKKIAAGVDGVEATAIKPKEKSFVVEGNFSVAALVKAMNDAGFHVKVK